MTLLFVIIAGLCWGSFITLASYRLPHGEDIVRKPSHCTACNHRLGARDLWPLLSWACALGRCRHCKAKVHWRYPAIEITTALTFVAVHARYGISWQGLVLMTLAVMLLIMIVADFEHYIIPDEVHIVLLPLAFVHHYVLNDTPWFQPLLGALAGLALGLLLHHGYRRLRGKEVLGFGDVKFLGVAGAWLGLQNFAPFLFYGGALGVLTGFAWRALKRGALFPFGPALAMALFLCVTFPETTEAFWRAQHSLVLMLLQ